MHVTWLAQGGLLFELRNGMRIMVDPYLSDYVEKNENPKLKRQVPVDERFLHQDIDVLVLTHIHTDHADPDTLRVLFQQKKRMHILSSRSVWEAYRGKRPEDSNAVAFDPECEFTIGKAVFCSVYAVHSDPSAIGIWFEADGVRVYVSGDTIYHPRIGRQMSGKVDLMFVCINGMGNNVNAVDAARITEEIRPAIAVPIHWDLLPGYMADPKEYTSLVQNKGISAVIMQEYSRYAISAVKGGWVLHEDN